MAGARIVAVLLCLGGKGSRHPDVSNFGMPRFLLTWAEGLRIPWRCWQSVGRCRASCRGQDGLDVCSEKPGSGTGPASQSILWWARLRRRVVGAGAPLMRPWPAGVLPKDRWRLGAARRQSCRVDRGLEIPRSVPSPDCTSNGFGRSTLPTRLNLRMDMLDTSNGISLSITSSFLLPDLGSFSSVAGRSNA